MASAWYTLNQRLRGRWRKFQILTIFLVVHSLCNSSNPDQICWPLRSYRKIVSRRHHHHPRHNPSPYTAGLRPCSPILWHQQHCFAGGYLREHPLPSRNWQQGSLAGENILRGVPLDYQIFNEYLSTSINNEHEFKWKQPLPNLSHPACFLGRHIFGRHRFNTCTLPAIYEVLASDARPRTAMPLRLRVHHYKWGLERSDQCYACGLPVTYGVE